jgi:YVTN family beta-propeller protein
MTVDERPLEDRLRDELTSWAGEAPLATRGWTEPRGRERGRRLATSPIGLAAIAAATVVAVFATVVAVDSRNDPTQTEVDVTGRQDLVIAEIPVGEALGVRVVAARAGALYVASENDRRLYRVDTTTDEVTHDIALAVPDSVATGDAAVFAIIDGPPRLARLAPDTLMVEATVEVSGGPTSVRVIDGVVWVPTQDGRLLRFEPDRLEALDPVPFDASPGFLAEGGAGVWRTILGSDTVVRIDPTTAQVIDRFTIDGEVRSLVVGAGDLWVGDVANDRVVRVDPTSGDVLASVPVGLHPSGMALGDDRLWVAGYDDGTLTEIDTGTNEVTATVPVGYVPGSVVLADGSLWVSLHREASVVRFDPERLATAALHPIDLDAQIVDVGGRELFVRCMGAGRPTVVLEAGGGERSSSWLFVQYGLQGSNRVCSYDRAGLGRSQPGPEPRTAERIVDDLHTGLLAAGERGPFVMVGHGYGGLYVRHFADRHPELVAGVVLVDAMSTSFIDEVLPLLSEAEREETQRIFHEDPEFQGARETFAQVALGGDLGSLPLVVIRRDPALSPFAVADLEALWQRHQRDQVSLSTGGQLVTVTGTGYDIPLDRPDEVVRAVRTIVDALR